MVDVAGFFNGVSEDVAFPTDFDNENADDQIPRVSLMTIHLAKGLEFPMCYRGDGRRLISFGHEFRWRSGLEEERCLFYVAQPVLKSAFYRILNRVTAGETQRCRAQPIYRGN